jgi:ubiquitin C-terminal hydrolase
MDLFAAYTAPEAVHGVACSSCSGQVVAHKTLSVARVPSALCILVQRLGVLGKSDAHIAFPLAARFTSRSMTAVPLGPGTAGAAGAPPHALVAVVEHLGSDGRGHYTVLRRVGGPADWVLISDASVTRVSLERVFAARAYMLFFSREVGSVGNGEASMH